LVSAFGTNVHGGGREYGTCNRTPPGWAKLFLDNDNPPRAAARAIRSLKNLQAYRDSTRRPYLHLVDGGVSDNVGMRGVLDALKILESLHDAGLPFIAACYL
jgi:NTE family protein